MHESLPKPWPRPSKRCFVSSKALTNDPFFYSALIQVDDQWVRIDISCEEFENWRAHQSHIIAWWKAYNSKPIGRGVDSQRSQCLEAFCNLILHHRQGIMEGKSKIRDECIFLLAMALQRRRLANVEFDDGLIHITSHDGHYLIDLKASCLSRLAHASTRRQFRQFCEAFGLSS